MGISFYDDLSRLFDDLERAGYTVVKVARFPQVPARTVQLRLSNGVVINWDRQAQHLVLEGPRLQRAKVEACLYGLYEGPWFKRSWLRFRHRINLAAVALALLVGGLAVAATLSRGEAKPVPVEAEKTALPERLEP